MTEDYELADPSLTLERARARIEHQNIALADLRAEIRTLGLTVARTERKLRDAEEQARAERLSARANYNRVEAMQRMSLFGLVRMWFVRRTVG